MTTYQDPPLQSRRAARQNERADEYQPPYPDASSSPAPPAHEAPLTPLTTPESLLYATQGSAVPVSDATALRGRRVAESTEDAATRSEVGYRVRDFSPEARRAALQNWSQPAPVEGNLTYHTQQRPPMPQAGAHRVAGRADRGAVPRTGAGAGARGVSRAGSRAS